MKPRISSHWLHDARYFQFPRTSGIPYGSFDRHRARWPWIVAVVVVAMLLAWWAR